MCKPTAKYKQALKEVVLKELLTTWHGHFISKIIIMNRFPRGLLTTALLVIVTWGIATARPFLVPVCIAALLGFLITPLIRILTRIHVPEWLAVTLGTILLLIPIPAVSYMLIRQATSLFQDIPLLMNSLNKLLNTFNKSKLGQSIHISDYLNPAALLEKLSVVAGESIQVILSGLNAVLNTGSQIALILLFTILMIMSRKHLRTTFEKILARYESIQGASMLDEVTTLIERFLLARLLIVIIVAAVDTIALIGFSVPYSFLMGTFLGIMTLLPAIGFILALIPPVIVSFAEGHTLASILFLVIVLLIMSIIEGNILSPKLVGIQLNINALSSFLGIFAGGLIWGIWGMLLCIPFLGVLRIIFSAVPTLQPWGDLLADKEDKKLSLKLMKRPSKIA